MIKKDWLRQAQPLLIRIGILLFLCISISLLSDKFFQMENLINVLRQISTVTIAACGYTMILICGGFDLSMGSVLAFSGVTAAILSSKGYPIGTSFVFGIIMGGIIGLINGIGAVIFRIMPFLVTLCTMFIARGLAWVFSGGQAVVVGLPDRFTYIGRGFWGFLPISIVIMGICIIVFHIILTKTVLGKHIYAIGGNLETSYFSGIATRKIPLLLYIVGGIMSGLAGVILASRLAAGDPNTGTGFEFDVIIATSIGGTPFTGGEGSVIGTLIGSLIMGVIGNGLNLMGVHAFYQYIIKGVILFIVVALDMAVRRGTFKALLGKS